VPNTFPSGITPGPDGNLWFTANGKVGRITPAGIGIDFPVPTSGNNPAFIAAGPDGTLWFTELGVFNNSTFKYEGGKIGEVTLLQANTAPLAAQSGVPFSGVVASFTDLDPGARVGDFRATIDWGDGTPAVSGTLDANAQGGFDVLGTHTFFGAGPVTMTVTLTDLNAPAGTAPARAAAGVPVAVQGPNTPPAIAGVADQTVPAGGAAGPLAFTVGDAETPADQLVVTAASSNPALASVSLGGSGANRTVTVTPAAGQSGTVTVTLTVQDRAGATATDTFAVTVLPPQGGPAGRPHDLSVGGAANGLADVYAPSAAGVYTNPPARQITTGLFPGFAGDVRTATGDFNADGFDDTVLVTGPGTKTVMAVVSGKDGSVLVPPTDPFGDANFTSGGFVTAGDIDHDGRAEWVVTPELKGGPRVVVFHLLADGSFDITSPGQPSLVANFFGIGDPSFRDGDRAALGDVNGDGTLDVFSIAAFNGGPRTALYDGKDVLLARGLGRDPVKLVGDFFAAPDGLDEGRGGRSIAAGDVNGDGVADLIVMGDNLLGTGNEVTVYSGADLVAGRLPGAGAAPLADFGVSGQPGAALISVALRDADGDGRADLIVGSGAGQPSLVRMYPGKTLSGTAEPPSTPFDPFGGPTTDGVFVG
jgi:hypothetical protein